MNNDPLLTLDDSRAQDPAVVGAKAAALALCKAQGLPVPAGFAVPVSWGDPSILAGAEALPHRGSGGARLAVTAYQIDPGASQQLEDQAVGLGGPLMVRSSAVVEADRLWSGAFSSFAQIQPDEVPIAVKACWSSVFRVESLKRLEAEQLPPEDVGMAILVQREIRADFGGIAEVSDDEMASVTWIHGPPALIVSGREPGTTSRLAPGAPPPAQQCDLAQVAEVARRAMRLSGFNRIEWAQDSERVWLLQASRAEREPREAGIPPVDQIRHPRVASLARLLGRYPGPAMEEWVLKWAIGLEHLPEPIKSSPIPLESLVTTLNRRAAELVAERWGRPSGRENGLPDRVLSELCSSSPLPALDTMSRLGGVDPVAAGELLGLIGQLEAGLVEKGSVPSIGTARHLSAGLLDELASGRTERLRAGHRFGMGRWEPLLFCAVIATGDPLRGTPVVGGHRAGPLRMTRGVHDTDSLEPREVLCAVYPMNNLSPLLWAASAVVTLRGGSGAHVFEVADALGVPAVCNVESEALLAAPREALIAVDGDEGLLWLLSP